MSITKDDFIRIWTEWDKDPRNENETGALLAADVELGKQLGLSHMEVRKFLAEHLREGKNYEEAFDAICSRGD